MAAIRIAFIAPGFSAHANDWAIPALLNLARTLAQTHELHIFSQRYPARGLYQFDGLTHHAVGGGQNFGLTSARIWLQTSQTIIRQHRQTPFDVLHAFWADEAGFSAALAGFRLKRPVVVSLGGGELTNLPDLHYGAQRFLVRRLTTRYALKKATLITAGSNYQLDLCRAHHVPEPKLRLAPLGVDTTLFQPINLIFPLQAKSTHEPYQDNYHTVRWKFLWIHPNSAT
jgi:glycosyltransferase involved in cell wall biosynthesis